MLMKNVMWWNPAILDSLAKTTVILEKLFLLIS